MRGIKVDDDLISPAFLELCEKLGYSVNNEEAKVEADPEGWIVHDGSGTAPVADHVLVNWRTGGRDAPHPDIVRQAGCLAWYLISHYRVATIDGWIPWDGTKGPPDLPKGTLVHYGVMGYKGTNRWEESCLAEGLDWETIVEYKIVNE